MLAPFEIVNKMLNNDAYSLWLGVDLLSINKGDVSVKMTVKKEMTNGFGIAHGGITYALSDSCLAFSANSHGIHAVSIETSISHLKPVNVGDTLIAKSNEISLTKRIGVYQIDVYNQFNHIVSTLKGTMYRTGKIWE
ncbi:MAG TPA: hotdog fold thioesterase [Crocinitomix sp.]|nr:hotdog fold thioesterase [Crocinitomix sp.]